ncbi:hypothetical protein [Paraclostridium bifermentans]|uniref:hypothetical protein n=1 Tax=Paraclostridium bifermentans TaxID=1490 RepID=UPI00359C6C79
MDYSKNKVSFLNVISNIACIIIISIYSFKDSSEIGVFGKIAVVFAAFGILINTSSLIKNIGDNIGASKKLLKTIDLAVFSVVGFLIGRFLI